MQGFLDWLFTTPFGVMTLLGAVFLVSSYLFLGGGSGRHRR